MNCTKNYSRDEWAASLPPGLIIAELGVFTGDFSTLLLNSNPKELHLIDAFDGVSASGDKDGLNMKTVDLRKEYGRLTQLYREDSRVRVHKGYTVPTLSDFPDNYFDLIYIDADHRYAGFRADLETSYSKIKSGGQICGHDYHHEEYPGIVMALEEFCTKLDIELDFLTNDRLQTFGLRISK